MKNQSGFTLIELVLVITILGILSISAFPNFIDISTQAEQASGEGVIGAIRTGISLFRANDLVQNGAPGVYPNSTTLGTADDLDNASVGPASTSNLFFSNVLAQGISSSSWSKTAQNEYVFNDGTTSTTYTYSSATGTFTENTGGGGLALHMGP